MNKLKPLNEQVMVITGASSGIGLATARLAAERGVRLVLAARGKEALEDLVEEIEQAGGEAIGVSADVASEEGVREIAEAAAEHFGGFDTWFNNAGVMVYGRTDEVPVEDERRLFDVDYWGTVYGSRAAAEHLKDKGGALINMGSAASDRAMPLLAAYSAAKHAIKGYTDALRMDLEQAGRPIAVTLIKPAFVNTPIAQHARNHLEHQPKLLSPAYAPEVVAEAVLHAAQYPRRDLVIGAGGRLISSMGQLAPRTTDKLMKQRLYTLQQSDDPNFMHAPDNLYAASEGGYERSTHPYLEFKDSLYTRAAREPRLAALLIAGLGALLASALVRRR